MTSRQWVRVAWWSWLSLLLLVGMVGTHFASVQRVEQVAQARADAYHDALRLSADDIFLTVTAREDQPGSLLDRITEVAGPTRELLGWTHDELRGKSIDVLMGADQAMIQAHRRAMLAAVKSKRIGQRSAIRCNVATRDGGARPVIILATATREEAGDVVYECVLISLLNATAIDLTEVNRTEQTLQRILRVVEELRDEPRQQQTITVQQSPTLADLIRDELERERQQEKGLQ